AFVPDALVQVTGGSVGRTGPDGSATIFNITAGPVTVTASAGLLAGHVSATVAPDVETAVTVSLDPVGTLRGRVFEPGGVEPVREHDLVLVGVGTVSGTVTDTADRPAPGLRVVLSSEAGPFGGAFEATTGPGGGYAISGVAVGRFRVTVSDGAGAQATATDTVGAHGQTVRLDLA